MKKITVYLADDHLIVVQGIAGLLNRMEEVAAVRIFKDGKSLFKQCALTLPDVCFIDIEMPDWDGRQTLVEIKKSYPSIRCFMLSMLNEKYIIEDCIKKGASGYLNKDCSTDELYEALTSETVYYSKEVANVLNGVKKSFNGFDLDEPLSKREQEILQLLCEGLSPKEISDKLFLSARTVETHKTNIMRKFDVSSVGKLISVAIKNKLV